MRKFVPLLFMLLFLQQVHANIIQGSYRWKNDTGGETSTAWKAAENTGITNVGSSDILRLRFSLYNSYNQTPTSSSAIQLWYNDGTTDQQVTTATTGAFMLAQASTTLTDGQATTAQLSGSLPFVPGKVITSSSDASIQIPGSSRTEYEWVIKPGTGLLTTRTYTFEIRGDIVVDPTGPAAILTTTGTLPLKLLSFMAQLDKKVALVWTTAEEDNVSHFEIEKSSDGNRYTVIGQMAVAAGSGTKTYQFTDNGTLTASNFYRLKMVDKDGRFTYSHISRVKTAERKNSLSVYPNPAKDRLNISLTAEAGEVKVTLQDAGGRTLKTFTVQSDGRQIHQVADISTLQKGIYFLSFNNQTVRFVKE